jgi:hypothetical protein
VLGLTLTLVVTTALAAPSAASAATHRKLVEGTVTVRRWHSATVLATAAMVEGHFEIWLAPDHYFLRAHPPEGSCRSGDSDLVSLPGRLHGPVAVSLDVHDSCAPPPGPG